MVMTVATTIHIVTSSVVYKVTASSVALPRDKWPAPWPPRVRRRPLRRGAGEGMTMTQTVEARSMTQSNSQREPSKTDLSRRGKDHLRDLAAKDEAPHRGPAEADEDQLRGLAVEEDQHRGRAEAAGGPHLDRVEHAAADRLRSHADVAT